MTKKDQKIIADAEREGIPIFVFIAKDKLSINALKSYLNDCNLVECSDDHCAEVIERIAEFQMWQDSNPEKVKIPD